MKRVIVLSTEADLAAGVRALSRSCPHMRLVESRVGQPPLRRYAADLKGLARIVVGQQLSIASAEAIWRRTEVLVEPFEAPQLARLSDAKMRSAGLSSAKMRTLRALAEAVNGGLDITALAGESDETVRERLTSVHGIGPWTADIFVLFCLGRADGWAAGDLALQVATQEVLGLPARPTASELEAHGQRWQPWRGVAARLLWADYGLRRARAKTEPV